MEQSTTTRDTPQWVQQWEAKRERGLGAYLLRFGIGYLGTTIFLTLSAKDLARGTLSETWFSIALWSMGVGLVFALIGWLWREAWYDHYRVDRR